MLSAFKIWNLLSFLSCNLNIKCITNPLVVLYFFFLKKKEDPSNCISFGPHKIWDTLSVPQSLVFQLGLGWAMANDAVGGRGSWTVRGPLRDENLEWEKLSDPSTPPTRKHWCCLLLDVPAGFLFSKLRQPLFNLQHGSCLPTLVRSLKSNWLVLSASQMLSCNKQYLYGMSKGISITPGPKSYVLRRVLRLRDIYDSLKLYAECNVC